MSRCTCGFKRRIAGITHSDFQADIFFAAPTLQGLIMRLLCAICLIGFSTVVFADVMAADVRVSNNALNQATVVQQ
jgi:hypothetical protein